MKVLSLISLLLFSINLSFTQSTYYVSTTGTDAGNCDSGNHCATVQYVIDSKALVPGDRIIIGAGTWTDEPITISSADEGDASGYVTIEGADSATTIFEHFLGATNQIHLNDADYIRIRNIKFDDASDDVIQISGGDNNLIENCWIRDGYDEVSIEASGSNTADNNTIKNCLLESDSYTFIDINGNNSGGTNNCDGNIFEDNVMKLLSGGSASPGVELSFATNTSLRRNRIYSNAKGIELKNTGGADNTTIVNNYIKTSDDAFYNNGGTSTSSNGTIAFNSIYCAKTCLYFRSISGNNNSGWTVKNNILYTTSSSSSEYCLRNDGSTNFASCDFNQYYHPNSARCGRFNGTSYSSLSGTGSTDWDELDHSNETGMTGDENSQEGNPAFNNPTSNNNDALDLLAGSPCFEQATTLNTSTVDIYSSSRPANIPAIGAFEDANAALPHKDLHFEAKRVQSAHHLYWNFESTQAPDHIELQKSIDGITWETISSNELPENIMEYELYSLGYNYYRLEITLNTGEIINEVRAILEHSNFMQNIRISNGLILFPDEVLDARIFDLNGKQLASNKFGTQLNLPNLSIGFYILNITDNKGDIYTKKLFLGN